MDSGFTTQGKGKRLALEVLGKKRSDIISKISEQEPPDSSFYAFLKQTRKRFFINYIDSLKTSVESGDTTDFLGNETFQSYTHARNGFSLYDVLSIPFLVKKAVRGVLQGMMKEGEAGGDACLEATNLIDEMLEQAEMVRAQSFTQTRDEVIKFFHSYQKEIDRFPSNLAATLDFRTLMLSAVSKALDLLDVGRCAFFSRDLLTNDLHLEASNFEHEKIFGEAAVKLDESTIEQLVHHQSPVSIEGHPRSVPLVSEIMKKMKSKSLLLVPLMVRDRNLGLMLLDNAEKPQMFTPEVVDLAVRYANKVAAAMENARLHGSEQQKLKETMALLEVSRLVTSTLDIDVLLSRLVQITADVCEIGKCTVFIRPQKDGLFYPSATFSSWKDSGWETSLGDGIGAEDMLDEEAGQLLDNCELVISEPRLCPFIPDNRIEDTGTRSILLVPVNSRERVLGIMVLFYAKEREDLESEDLNLVSAIAGQAAVALENASLYEDLEMSYFSTVKSLARAIEVKDPYTYGHSEKVTEYCMVLARHMGLSERERRNLKYAAALHDIGKIGIARKILNKAGALTEEEFLEVKTHPELGDSIIEPVAFLQEPRSIILYHHERYDGNGYPNGLKAEEIPLGARVLAVADSFEAMMSDRPYRKALPLAEALKELEVNSGTQFDPRVVEAFLEALTEGELSGVEGKSEPAEDFEEERSVGQRARPSA